MSPVRGHQHPPGYMSGDMQKSEGRLHVVKAHFQKSYRTWIWQDCAASNRFR